MAFYDYTIYVLVFFLCFFIFSLPCFVRSFLPLFVCFGLIFFCLIFSLFCFARSFVRLMFVCFIYIFIKKYPTVCYGILLLLRLAHRP